VGTNRRSKQEIALLILAGVTALLVLLPWASPAGDYNDSETTISSLFTFAGAVGIFIPLCLAGLIGGLGTLPVFEKLLDGISPTGVSRLLFIGATMAQVLVFVSLNDVGNPSAGYWITWVAIIGFGVVLFAAHAIPILGGVGRAPNIEWLAVPDGTIDAWNVTVPSGVWLRVISRQGGYVLLASPTGGEFQVSTGVALIYPPSQAPPPPPVGNWPAQSPPPPAAPTVGNWPAQAPPPPAAPTVGNWPAQSPPPPAAPTVGNWPAQAPPPPPSDF